MCKVTTNTIYSIQLKSAQINMAHLLINYCTNKYIKIVLTQVVKSGDLFSTLFGPCKTFSELWKSSSKAT